MLTGFEMGLIRLVHSGLTNQSSDLPDGFDIECIYSVAKQHRIRFLMLCGASACMIDSELEVMKRLLKGAFYEIRATERQLYEYRRLTELLEENGIEYMPLKGIMLRYMYPQFGMRSMGDIDILVHPEQYDRIKNKLIELGFEFDVESDHEYIWHTSDGVVIEFHKRLIPSYNRDYYAYFGDGWSRAKRLDENGFLFRMSAEDEFVYLFTHFSKHYRDGGIGIKHLTDLWLYVTKVKLDRNYILAELEKLGLDEFYQNLLRVMDFWFADGERDEITDLISSTILNSGAYGKQERNAMASVLRKRAENPQAKNERVFLKKLFLPYPNMCIKYPYLKKCPVLLPAAHIIRITDAIFNKQDRIAMHAKDIKFKAPNRVEEYERQLKAVGLSFDFKDQINNSFQVQ